MMTKTQDYGKMMQDMVGSFPIDAKAMQDALRTSATLGERMSKVVLDAAGKSSEISTKWTRETLAHLGEVSRYREEPADYTTAMTDYASAQAETASENMASFAEVAKRVQMDTVELMLAAGKDMSEDATTAVKKATADVTSAARKATVAAK